MSAKKEDKVVFQKMLNGIDCKNQLSQYPHSLLKTFDAELNLPQHWYSLFNQLSTYGKYHAYKRPFNIHFNEGNISFVGSGNVGQVFNVECNNQNYSLKVFYAGNTPYTFHGFFHEVSASIYLNPFPWSSKIYTVDQHYQWILGEWVFPAEGEACKQKAEALKKVNKALKKLKISSSDLHLFNMIKGKLIDKGGLYPENRELILPFYTHFCFVLQKSKNPEFILSQIGLIWSGNNQKKAVFQGLQKFPQYAHVIASRIGALDSCLHKPLFFYCLKHYPQYHDVILNNLTVFDNNTMEYCFKKAFIRYPWVRAALILFLRDLDPIPASNLYFWVLSHYPKMLGMLIRRLNYFKDELTEKILETFYKTNMRHYLRAKINTLNYINKLHFIYHCHKDLKRLHA